MSKVIFGNDSGNFEGKTVGAWGVDSWKTNISEATDRKVIEVFGEDDMEFEFCGRKGLAGSIAKYESRYGSSSMYGQSKAHWYTQVRVLLSIYRYTRKYELSTDAVSIVTGQPYVGHTEEEKKELKRLLEGSHEIVVNGEKLTINIENAGIAPEGVGAFFGSYNKPKGKFKLLDVGSGTVNAISWADYRVTNFNSATFNYGTEVISMDQVARGIIQDATNLGWSREDKILLCGGSSEEIIDLLSGFYPSIEILEPHLLEGNRMDILEPKFANAAGYYVLAKGEFS